MISGGSSAQQSIAQDGQEGWEEIQSRSCGEGRRKEGCRGRGFPLLGAQGGSRDPARAGDPRPAQLPILFSRRGASSLSCLTARAARGQRGRLGTLGTLPAAWEVAKHPRRPGCSPHAPHARAERVLGMLTPRRAQPRDAHPTQNTSEGCPPHTKHVLGMPAPR